MAVRETKISGKTSLLTSLNIIKWARHETKVREVHGTKTHLTSEGRICWKSQSRNGSHE